MSYQSRILILDEALLNLLFSAKYKQHKHQYLFTHDIVYVLILQYMLFMYGIVIFYILLMPDIAYAIIVYV